MEDRDEVLYSGPYTINNRPIIVKAWAADFNLNDEVLRTILFGYNCQTCSLIVGE